MKWRLYHYRYPIVFLWLIIVMVSFFDIQWSDAYRDKAISSWWHDERTDHHNLSSSQLSGTMRIITGPSDQTRNIRRTHLSQNNDFVWMWLYDISYRTAKSRLVDQSTQRDMRLILEQDKYRQHTDTFRNLQEERTDTPITLLSDRTLGINNMHAKAFVGDNNRIIQTANLNRSSFVYNREHFVLGDDLWIRDNLQQLFELDQQTILFNRVDRVGYDKLMEDLSPHLLICPLNCRDRIEHLLHNAQESILFSAQYITDDNIIRILQSQSHLDIRVRTNDFDSNRELLRQIGKDRVIFESSKLYNHDKLVIIDGRYMIIGSMNFSQNALDNNREIGIIITDPDLIKQITTKLF